MATATPDRTKGHKTRAVIKLLSAQPKAKLTDAQLAKAMLTEYPDSESNWENRMPALRRLYNLGKLPGMKGKPGTQIQSYGGKVTTVTKPEKAITKTIVRKAVTVAKAR